MVEFGSESILSRTLVYWMTLFLHQSHCLLYIYFKWYIYSWYNFVGQMHVDIYLFLLDFSSLLQYTFSKWSLMLLWISLVFVVRSSFSPLILLIWVFLSINLVYISKNKLISLISLYFFLVSILLISALILLIYA
jgi:hypothetical protein